MTKFLSILALFVCTFSFSNPNSAYWRDVDNQLQKRSSAQIFDKEVALVSRYLRLDSMALKEILFADSELLSRALSAPSLVIDFPLPNGLFERVKLIEYQLLSPELQRQYPDIKAWRIKGVDQKNISGRIDYTPAGFHGMLVMPNGDTIYVDPDKDHNSDIYQSFSKLDNASHFKTDFNCDVHSDHSVINSTKHKVLSRKLLQQPSLDLITYRLALSGTAEYTSSQGGSESAYSSMITTINRVNEIYQRDIGISLQLTTDESLVYLDSEHDPFTSNNADALVEENIINTNKVIGSSEYDVGHVFDSSTIGGLAYLGVACLADYKAGGATGITNPSGETFSIEYVAHEIGHQLGANHTFNSNQNGCGGGNRNQASAVEPGSGSSIMSYAGLCGSDNLQFSSDATFHWKSIEQIHDYTRTAEGKNCGLRVSMGNQDPVASAGDDIRIPINTPFLLSGSATGASSYSWDQMDTGSASSVNVDQGNNALIRQLLPSNKPNRFIPRVSDLFSDITSLGETLPTSIRELNFSFVARDGNGGISNALKKINVTDTGRKFSVLSQSTAMTLSTGQTVDVVWEVAGTNNAPINCSNVDVNLLREDGHMTVLLEGTENDGVEQFVIPSDTPLINNSRIMVICNDQSFFQISKGNITIEEGVGDLTAPVITILGLNPVTIVQGENYIDEGATANDNVDGSIIVLSSGIINTSQLGDQTITYTATDNAGNTATLFRIVSVIAPIDLVPPVITLIGESQFSIFKNENYIEHGATATDNVDSIVSVIISGSVNPSVVGEYTITYTSTDNSGNSSDVSRLVSVINDNTAPEITLTGEIVVNLFVGENFEEPGFSGFDNVDGEVTVDVSGEVDTNKIGTYILTYTALDKVGNEATKIRTIIVTAAPIIDDQAPVINLIGESQFDIVIGEAYIELGATVIDNLDVDIALSINGTVDSSRLGTYIISYVATDKAGNTTSVERKVNVIEIPELVAPPEIIAPDVNTLTSNVNNSGGNTPSSGGGSFSFSWLLFVLVTFVIGRRKH